MSQQSRFTGSESAMERTKRKVTENPFVLPAVAVTFYGLWDMLMKLYKNDRMGFQRSQRLRIGAQIMTFGIVFGGMWYQNIINEQKKKEHDAF